MNRKACQFIKQKPQLRAEDDGPTMLTGYGAVFYDETNPLTEYRLGEKLVERIMPGAFDNIDTDVISCFNHDPNQLLGRMSSGTLSLEVDDTGLKYSVAIDEDDPDHQRVKAKMARGDVDGSSFWFHITDEAKRIEDGQTIYEIRGVELIEVGPVTEPAYKATSSKLRDERTAQAEVEVEPEGPSDAEKKQADLDYIKVELWANGIE